MTPSDFREHSRLAGRANAGIERAFALFMALTASRAHDSPERTLEAVEAAMNVWTPYEDRNRMEMPDFPRPVLVPDPLPITAYAIISPHGSHGVEIYSDKDSRLAVFEMRSDAERTAEKLGENWKVAEVRGRFAETVGQPV